MARNRVIYQSEALFVSPNATGAHFTCSAVLTGFGPTGFNTRSAGNNMPIAPFYRQDLTQSAGIAGAVPLLHGSGNAPALMHLMDSDGVTGAIGLNQDPTLTYEYQDSSLPTWGDINAAGNILNAKTLGLADLANLSGKVEAMFTTHVVPTLDAAFGYQDSTRGTGPGKGFAQGVTNGFSPNSGTKPITGAHLHDGNVVKGAGIAQVTGASTGDLLLFSDTRDWQIAYDQYLAFGLDCNTCGFGALLQPWSGSYQNLVQQVHRVQSANYSFTINRTDVNTFGQLARIDAIALEPPTVNLDFTYFPTDGFNERNLGFYLVGEGEGVGMGKTISNSATNHLKSDGAGRNFFIVTTPESTDAFNTLEKIETRSVIGLGNGFLSDYTLEASVGSIPTASATIELYNAKSDIGTTGVEIPGVDLQKGVPASGINFSLGHPEGLRGDDQGASPNTGVFGYAALSALRPGDITLELPEGLSMFSRIHGDGAIHIQNFSLSLPLSRSPIDKLGTRFAFSRVVDLPVVATMSVSALLSEVGTGNLALILDDCKEHDVKITMKGNKSCVVGDNFDAMVIDFKGARIDSESISSDIGSNKSVDFTFTTQIGGPEDLLHGVFISGANPNVIPEHKSIPGR
jgi:hypothetical protein